MTCLVPMMDKRFVAMARISVKSSSELPSERAGYGRFYPYPVSTVTTMRHSPALRNAVQCMLLAALIPTAPSIEAQAAAWKPGHPVEMIIGVSPGGGIDRMARTMQRILQERRLLETPMNVANKPGGGGNIALNYLQQHAGDAHFLQITATSLLTNHIVGKSQFSHHDFTPIAMLTDEYIGVLVRDDSPLRNGRDLMNTVGRSVDSLPIGIATTAGNTNHITAALVAKAGGAEVKKLKIVVFGSGGEAMTALLGGHVAVVATPAANGIAHMQAGKI